MPKKVDALASLGVVSPTPAASGPISQLRGQPIIAVLSPNTKALFEWQKKAEGEWNSGLGRALAGSVVDMSFDQKSYLGVIADMLKANFAQVRVAGTLTQAAELQPAATVIVDYFVTVNPGGRAGNQKIWEARLDFLVPSDSKRVHRTVESVVQVVCETTPAADARCNVEGNDRVLKELREKLNAAVSGN